MTSSVRADTPEHNTPAEEPAKELALPEDAEPAKEVAPASEQADPDFDRVLWFFKLFMDEEFNDMDQIRTVTERFRGVPHETFLYHLMHHLESDPALRDKSRDAFNVCVDILFRKRARKLRRRAVIESLPNCFVIGQPRSGTTSLHAFFRTHPEVFVPAAKEVHYYSHFSKPVLGSHGMDLDYYRMYFMEATNERIRCDISPHYISEPGVALRIARDVPDAKVIAFLREPVNRLISMYNLNFPWTTKGNIDKWFREGMDGLRQNAPRWDHTGAVSVLFHSFIAQQLSEYKRYFGALFKIYIFEDMIADQERCYHEICDFLGIERRYGGPYWDMRAPNRVNPSAGILRSLQTLLLPEVKRIEAVIDQDLSRWYQDWDIGSGTSPAG
jgi:sulfotransferase family protein